MVYACSCSSKLTPIWELPYAVGYSPKRKKKEKKDEEEEEGGEEKEIKLLPLKVLGLARTDFDEVV